MGLKAQTASRSGKESLQENDVYPKALIIRSLENRIRSLERQLEQKQAIIEKLLDGPRQTTCTQSMSKSTTNLLGVEAAHNDSPDREKNKKISMQSMEAESVEKNYGLEGGKCHKETAFVSDFDVERAAQRGCAKILGAQTDNNGCEISLRKLCLGWKLRFII